MRRFGNPGRKARAKSEDRLRQKKARRAGLFHDQGVTPDPSGNGRQRIHPGFDRSLMGQAAWQDAGEVERRGVALGLPERGAMRAAFAGRHAARPHVGQRDVTGVVQVVDRSGAQFLRIGLYALGEFIAPLSKAAGEWQALTMALAERAQANPEELGAAAVDYLYYSGYVALAYMWARSVAAAEGSAQSAAFRQAKRDTARFYFARMLPRCAMHRAAIEAGVASIPSID